MEAYVASLPRGLDSYPACQQKAVILREFLSRAIQNAIQAALPDELRALAEQPPAVTQWISEVRVTAIYLAHRDSLGGDDAFADHAYTVNRRLLSGPMYRVLFAVASPARVLRGATSRWGQMHRGTELTPRHTSERDAVFHLSAPLNLVPRVIALAYATGYRVALELAGAREAKVECDEAGPAGHVFRASWR